jgi:hypothetical protein
MIFMRGGTSEISHYFAPGPPCQTAYAPALVPRDDPGSGAEVGRDGGEQET